MSDQTTCRACNTTFSIPSKLKRHQERKTPCAPILDLEDLTPEVQNDPDLEKKKCRFCGRVLSSYIAMRRHVRQSCKIAPTARNGDAGMELLFEHTLRKQQAKISNLETMMSEQTLLLRHIAGQDAAGLQLALPGRGAASGASGASGAVAALQGGEVAVAQSGDGTIQVDNSKTVTINVFGQEDKRHITRDDIRAILDEAMRAPGLPLAAKTALAKTAMLIYSDPAHPENLTCYLPNKREGSVLVHTATGWEVQPIALVMVTVTQQGVDLLFDRQPDEKKYAPVMRELRDHEDDYAESAVADLIKPLLVRNKALVAEALGALPRAGDK